MTKHGYCLKKKRNWGKKRKKKPLYKTKRFPRSRFSPDTSFTYMVGHFKTHKQASLDGCAFPSRKRVILNRRRRRHDLRSCAVSTATEVREEKRANKREVENLKKIHAKKTRQFQKRFLRDIHQMWEEQAQEMKMLEKGI